MLRPNEARLVLVDRNNYFLFTPMLHEVATGGLNRQHIIEPIRKILRQQQDDLWVAGVKSLDLEKQIVKTNQGVLNYDYLVIATGADTNFFEVRDAQENSYTLKNLGDAVKLKNHFIDVFERAAKIDDAAKRRTWLSFAVVGGGATGVELAAEMADFFYKTFQNYYRNIFCAGEVKLYLVHRGEELLEQFHLGLREKALQVLRAKGVEIRLKSGVREVSVDGLTIEDGSFIPAKTVVWVAGVKANVPEVKQDLPTNLGRIVVDDFLRVKNLENVFALGDAAYFLAGTNDQPLPMLAQVATREAKAAARNIVKAIRRQPPREFWYRSKGELISLGQWRAIGNVFNAKVSGPHIWWLWRTVYLLKFNSWSKRIKISLDWTINLFAPRDIAKTE